MIAKYLLAALTAGLIAGFLATGAQHARVVPLILQAEKYETAPDHHHGETVAGEDEAKAAAQPETATGAHKPTAADAHDHNDATAVAEAGPEESGVLFGMSRLAGTLMANLVAGCGFALLLVAASLLTGRNITLGNGVLWGAAGWLIFSLLPAIGLPPELPGFPAGDLVAQQSWWFATVVASAAGLYGLVLRDEPWARIFGLLLIIAPHIIGAPMPESIESNVPAVLAAEFAVAALATGLAFWLLLGLALGFFNEKFVKTG